MKPSNSKSLRNSFAALCVLGPIAVGFPAVAQKQQALKDVFKNDFKIGAALNRRQIFEERRARRRDREDPLQFDYSGKCFEVGARAS